MRWPGCEGKGGRAEQERSFQMQISSTSKVCKHVYEQRQSNRSGSEECAQIAFVLGV
jgi:hypothetical protein